MGRIDLEIELHKLYSKVNKKRLERLNSGSSENNNTSIITPNDQSSSATVTTPTTLINKKATNTKRTVPLKLYLAAMQSDVDYFIQVLDEISQDMKLSFHETLELVNLEGDTLLHVAAREKQKDIAMFLIEHYPSLLLMQNLAGDTALHVGVRVGHHHIAYAVVKYIKDDELMNSGTSITTSMLDLQQLLRIKNNKGNTLMHEWVLSKRCDFFCFYSFNYGAYTSLNNEGKSPLYYAVEAASKGENGHFNLISDAVQKMGRTKRMLKGKSPLLPAIIARNKDVLDKVIGSQPKLIYLVDEEGKTPLHLAVSSDHIDMVQYFIAKDVECLLKRDNDGFFPIHIAAARGHVEVVKELLQHYPDSKTILTCDGQNILHIAAARGKEKVVGFILENPSLDNLINEADVDGNTPLHLATTYWQPKIVSALAIDKRVNVTVINNQGFKALNAAEYYIEIATKPSWQPRNQRLERLKSTVGDPSSSSLAITSTLQPEGSRSSASSSTHAPLSKGEKYGSLNSSFIGKSRSKQKQMPLKLYKAAMQSDIDHFIQVLEEISAEMKLTFSEILELLSPMGNTLLHVAAREKQEEIVMLLAYHSSSLLQKQNLVGDTALHLGIRADGIGVAFILLQFRGERVDRRASSERIAEVRAKKDNKNLWSITNKKGNTALHELAMNRHVLFFSSFIDSDPEICNFLNMVNYEGKSPLYYVAKAATNDEDSRHLISILDILKRMENKENILRGKSPLLPAIAARNKDVLDKIISTEPAFIKVLDEGQTPLHFSSSLGDTDITQYLLDKDVECSLKWDYCGFFPVHVAAAHGHVQVVKMLLQHCPDPREMLTHNGQNILHVAAARGREKVVGFILKDHTLEYLINETDNNGNTPLHLAAINWHPKIVSTLTWDKRVNIRIINNKGFTALDAAEYYMEQPASFDRRITWTLLKAAKVPRAPKKESLKFKKDYSIQSHTSNKSYTDIYKDRVNTLLLVATLVATITFAAGFTMPGGYKNSEPNEGMATMLQKRAFYVFVFSDTIALYSSILVVVSLIWAQLGDLKLVHTALRLAIPLLGVSLAMMSLAFMVGVYLVVSTLNWLAYSVLIMGSTFLCAHLVIFLPLCFPITSGNTILRYISYYPLQLLILVTSESKSDV